MKKIRDTFRLLVAVCMICFAAGCSTIMQELVDTAVAEHAELRITGDAQFVELQYMLVDQEYTGAPDIPYRSSRLGDHVTRNRLPISKTFLVNAGDELHLHCRLGDTSGVARLVIMVEDKEQRSFDLTPDAPIST